MQFKDIEGQQVLINRLTEIIDAGRVSHAQMFLGPTASGSLALAIAYAQYLNCSNRLHFPEGSVLRADSCGECPNCRKYRELSHPDLHFVFPNIVTQNIKSEHACSDLFLNEFREFLNGTHQLGTESQWYQSLNEATKQGMIRERDAANIVKALSLKSYEGGYKVLIIWMAERMNASAANELLKTLEEPNENTLILLVAENRDRLLTTIISRVQQVAVPDLGKTLSEERRAELSALFVSWMRLLFKLNMQPLSEWVEKTAAMTKDNQKQFLQFAQESIRACFLKTAADISLPGELQFGDEKFDTFFPTMVTVNNVEQMDQSFSEAISNLERNAYSKILFMQLSFTLSKLIKKR